MKCSITIVIFLVFLCIICLVIIYQVLTKSQILPSFDLLRDLTIKNDDKEVIYAVSDGRLGNQMFIVASNYGIAKDNDKELIISGLDKAYTNNIFKDINTSSGLKLFMKTYREPKSKYMLYNKINLSKGKVKTIGYFQNEKYFKKYKEDIFRMFKGNEIYNATNSKYKDRLKESYFIHIRLGDYLNFKNNRVYNVCTDDFFKTAIVNIKQNDNNPKFKIFSDEIGKCENLEYLKGLNVEFMDIKDPIESIYAMSLCEKGGICSNSSFSWWGSYLNDKPDKIVIFPTPWKKDIPFEKTDIYYDNSRIFPVKYPITMVSGYWRAHNKHGDKFNNYFKNTLPVNNPMIFFGSKETIEMVKPHRKLYPTIFVELDLKDFETNNFKDKIWVNKRHQPSKELGMIWNEKIFLMKKAKDMNSFNSDFYLWYDAGFSKYRNKKCPETILSFSKKISSFPKDKIIHEKNKNTIQGGAFILHKSIIDDISNIFKEELINTKVIKTDQDIWREIKKKHPNKFLLPKKLDYYFFTRDKWARMIDYLNN